MTKFILLGLTVAALSAPALAQDAPPPAGAVRVVLETSAGTILVETDPRAPITAANFLSYVDEGRFNGTDFYRGMELGGGTGVVQGGTANAPDRILPPIAHEPTSQTGLRHVDGALSMARFDPGTADAASRRRQSSEIAATGTAVLEAAQGMTTTLGEQADSMADAGEALISRLLVMWIVLATVLTLITLFAQRYFHSKVGAARHSRLANRRCSLRACPPLRW